MFAKYLQHTPFIQVPLLGCFAAAQFPLNAPLPACAAKPARALPPMSPFFSYEPAAPSSRLTPDRDSGQWLASLARGPTGCRCHLRQPSRPHRGSSPCRRHDPWGFDCGGHPAQTRAHLPSIPGLPALPSRCLRTRGRWSLGWGGTGLPWAAARRPACGRHRLPPTSSWVGILGITAQPALAASLLELPHSSEEFLDGDLPPLHAILGCAVGGTPSQFPPARSVGRTPPASATLSHPASLCFTPCLLREGEKKGDSRETRRILV